MISRTNNRRYEYLLLAFLLIITEKERRMMNKFETGLIMVTRDVGSKLNEDRKFQIFVNESINRHRSGDWGDLDGEDKQLNEKALENGGSLLSSYKYEDGTKIWIITKADRSVTTILFPEEY